MRPKIAHMYVYRLGLVCLVYIRYAWQNRY